MKNTFPGSLLPVTTGAGLLVALISAGALQTLDSSALSYLTREVNSSSFVQQTVLFTRLKGSQWAGSYSPADISQQIFLS